MTAAAKRRNLISECSEPRLTLCSVGNEAPMTIGVTFVIGFVFVCFTSVLEAQESTKNADQQLAGHLDVLSLPHDPITATVEDRIHRLGAGAVVGHLKSLMAFATVEVQDVKIGTQASGRDKKDNSVPLPETVRFKSRSLIREIKEIHISRDEIDFILLDGKSFPTIPEPLPPDKDAIVTTDGKIVSGTLTVSGDSVMVASQSFSQDQVALIYLKKNGIPQPRPAAQDPAADGQDGSKTNDESDSNSEDKESHACWHGRMVCTSTVHDATTGLHRRMEFLLITLKECRFRGGESFPITSKERYRGGPDLKLVWAQYELSYFERDEDDYFYEYKPNPYEVSGVLRDHQGYLHRLGHICLRTPELEKQAIKLGSPVRHGHYWIRAPGFLPSKLGWPGRASRFMGTGDWAPNRIYMHAASSGFGTEMDYSRRLGDGLTRMVGRRTFRDRVAAHWIEDEEFEWDLVRLDRCPPPPAAEPERKKDNCDFEQQRLDEIIEFQKDFHPEVEALRATLAADVARYHALGRESDFYEPAFIDALRLAIVGEASMAILKTFGPKALASRAPATSIAKDLPKVLDYLREAFPKASKGLIVYSTYQKLRAAEQMMGDYDAAMDYIQTNMETFSGDDNPISIKARRFVAAQKRLGSLIGKLRLLMEDVTRLDGHVRSLQIQREMWEEELKECKEHIAAERGK